MTRRTLLRSLAVSPGAFAVTQWRIGTQAVRVLVVPVTERTTRISILPAHEPHTFDDGSLTLTHSAKVSSSALSVAIGQSDQSIRVTETSTSRLVQTLLFDRDTGTLTFELGDGPIFGLGEGGPQFDRRGELDEMHSGQGGYKLHTHGGRVPIPWLIGTSGWAMFVHRPYGSFDLRGAKGMFRPNDSTSTLRMELFITGASDPKQVMTEYSTLTGYPELPPRWALGYHQSHRTLAGPEEILAEADTFREKRLPCDSLIFLGTGFCPSGWNTANGSFSFNPKVFPEPEKLIQQLHQKNFKVSLHVVIWSPELHGRANDTCLISRFDESKASCHWDAHRKVFAMGVDGWWPDEGDPLDVKSRLARNRLYFEGPQIDRPNERPFALHRNGYAGMQRYAAFLWSGDVYSTWETLRVHVPIGINTGLSGIPYWGTDIGGFVPTKELTGELYVRWFQFGSFCTLFRSHGRTWKLRLPWGWNTGDTGTSEVSRNDQGAADPDISELHNAEVEPICRKYLELRYKLMPYLYTAVREACDTGLPVMRAAWLHYHDDPAAVARSDQYLWGRDILVAPITEKGAKERSLYLPRGTWFDFWTGDRLEGGREISRKVDLATMPIFVRAGAIIPMDPVRQYTDEKVEGPLTLWVYPGSDGEFVLYEDDGKSLNYRRGESTRLLIRWQDQIRRISLELAQGSRMIRPLKRHIQVRLATEPDSHTIVFEGLKTEIEL